MDFNMKFLKLKDLVTNIKYNSILIVVDKFTKYMYLILYIENSQQNRPLRLFWIELSNTIEYQKLLY